jgi:hypothetical protein
MGVAGGKRRYVRRETSAPIEWIMRAFRITKAHEVPESGG